MQPTTALTLTTAATAVVTPLSQPDFESGLNTAMSETQNSTTGTSKGGGKPGNQNAAKHGLDSAIVTAANRQHLRYGLPAPQLPKECRFIDWRVDGMRRELEDAVLERHGQVDITHADAIATACDAEKGRQYLYSRLRAAEEAGKPQPLQIVATVMTTIAKLAESRSKAIKSLSLGRQSTADAWELLDASQASQRPANENHNPPAVDAAESSSGPQGAAHEEKAMP